MNRSMDLIDLGPTIQDRDLLACLGQSRQVASPTLGNDVVGPGCFPSQ